jgi:RimJ/RimL family protein N-acetyltransferase
VGAVRLRALTLTDVPALAALAHVNAEYIAQGMRRPPTDLAELLRHMTGRYLASAEGRRQEYLIESSRTILGLASLIPIDDGEPGDTEVVIWVASSHSDSGVGREALSQLTSMAPAGRLFARILTSNAASRRIFELNGFVPTDAAPLKRSSDQVTYTKLNSG